MSEQTAPASPSAPPPVNPAQVYDDVLVPAMFKPWADELLARVPIRPGDRVLDIACGTGAVTRKLVPRIGPEGAVTGLDINPAMLAVARAKPAPHGAPIRWVEGSGEDLPFDDASFDAVVCQQGLQFMPDRATAVREMRRVLRAGGTAGASMWRDTRYQGLLGAISEAMDRHFGKPANDPFSFGDAAIVRSLFVDAGFGDVTVEAVRRQVHFRSADELVRMAVSAAAAVIPELAEASETRREEAIAAIREEVRDAIAAAQDGEGATFSMEAHVVTAT
ncbi:MAG TPA: methyltransferase domain-containing protein [Thermomicrobiales bacterium]|nr:methyltransferase domain-containing protein [Thermomicrobiales bacterium]